MMRPLVLLVPLLLVAAAACPKKDASLDVRAPATKTSAPTTTPDATASPDDESAPAFVRASDGARAVVLYTASVEGYVTPCGCTGDPLGGVARLAGAFGEARAAYGERVFFVDGGDLLFERTDDHLAADRCQAEARHALLVDTYARLGLVGTVLGTKDDVRGPEWRDALLAARAIPTLDAVGPPRPLTAGAQHLKGRVVVRGGLSLGFTGFTWRLADDASEAERAPEILRLRVALETEARRLVAEGARAVIALSQAPRSVTDLVALDLTGVDVVIQGKAPGEAPTAPVRTGEHGPVVVASGMQAQHLGILELSLDERTAGTRLALDDRAGEAQRRARLLDVRIAKYAESMAGQSDTRRAFIEQKLASAREERARVFIDAAVAKPPVGPYVTARSLALTRRRAEEPEAALALQSYEARVPELVATCEAGISCPEPAPGAAVFVGVEACFQCHRDAVQFWNDQRVTVPGVDGAGKPVMRTLGHSKAWQTLVEVGKEKDRECVGCHSVGFNVPGGYCKTGDVEFRTGVQCESCHGPGSRHIEATGDPRLIENGSLTETTCRKCHHVPHIPTTESFVFDDKLLHVLGTGHGEARRNAILKGRGSTTDTPRSQEPR
jgi:hypothetical protein